MVDKENSIQRADAEKETAQHIEHDVDSQRNLMYENAEEEPQLTARTYVALLSMWLLNFVQVLALHGPSAVVSPLRLTPQSGFD